MSVCTGSAWPPAASISAAALNRSCRAASGSSRSVFAAITMFAPSRAARLAIARPMPRDAPVMKRVLPLQVHRRCVAPSCRSAAHRRRPDDMRGRALRRRCDTPARRGESRRSPCNRRRGSMSIGTCETSLRPAAQRAIAMSCRRASRPTIQRSGCGSSGNWCIGGNGANTTWRPPRGRAASRRAPRAAAPRACDGTWSITSLTPMHHDRDIGLRRALALHAARAPAPS